MDVNINKNCLNIYDKLGNLYTFNKVLGEGANGTVLLACKHKPNNLKECKNCCKYAAKFIKLEFQPNYYIRHIDIETNQKYLQKILDIKKEIEIQKMAFKYGFAPDIQVEVMCEDYYIFIMDLLTSFVTFNKYKETNSQKNIDIMKKKIAKRIKELNSIGIEHFDLHGENIIIRDKDPQIMIIDYGLAELKNPNEISNESEKFLNDEYEHEKELMEE